MNIQKKCEVFVRGNDERIYCSDAEHCEPFNQKCKAMSKEQYMALMPRIVLV